MNILRLLINYLKGHMSKGKELIKNTLILLIGKLFTQFLSFFLLPLYTNTLAASEYGLIDLILSYISLLAPAITIQQEMATFRFLVDARNDKGKIGKIIKTSFRSMFVRLSIVVVPCVLVSVFCRLDYLFLSTICCVFISISNLLLQIARGLGDNMKYAIGSVLSGVILLLSNVLLICVFGFGAESILISTILANAFCSLYLFLALRTGRFLIRNDSDSTLKKEMLKYSWPLVPNNVSWWLINTSDRTIVSIILGTAANGIYAIATKFPSIVSSFIGIFIMSWTESASLHVNDSDCDKFFSSVANNTLRLFSSLSILLIAVLPLVFDIIIGREYHESYNYIPIAIIGVLMNSIVSVYSAIYVAKKMTKKVAMTSILSAIINIIVDLVLIHFIGLYAAVISTAVAFFIMAVYRHFDLKKYVAIKYNIWDIVSALVGIIVISIIYYSGNTIWFIIGVVFAVIYSMVLNRKIIAKLWKKIFKTSK